MEFKGYAKTNLSYLDSNLPDEYSKISIKEYNKNNSLSSKFNGLIVKYCKLNICDTKEKPCSSLYGFCPYLHIEKLEKPRSNSRKYKTYIDEFNIQMTILHLNSVWNDDVEKAIKGELSQDEYDNLLIYLVDNLDDFIVKKALNSYHNIFSDIRRLKKEKIKNHLLDKEVLLEIGDYFYIEINYLPNLLDENGKSIWYKLDIISGWIEKDKFNKELWFKIKNNKINSLSYQSHYDYLVNKLGEKLDSKYGLITLFNLS